MKCKSLKLLFVVAALAGMLFAVSVQAAEILTEEDFVKKIVVEEQFIKLVDNFIILFDSSSSMNEPVKKGATTTQYDVAKQILKAKHMRLPDLGFNSGLYLFTPYQEVYPMGPYDAGRFGQAIDGLPAVAKGPTFLTNGLIEVEKVLAGLSGKTAVFIFSDGSYTEGAGLAPPALTERIAKNNNVCFYIISDAQTSREEKVVSDMAKANSCSRVIPFDTFVNNPEYMTGALYLVKSTEKIETITDSKIVGLEVGQVLYDFNQAEIRPEFLNEVDALGSFLQKNPDAYVLLEGYTDSVGSQEYNLALSQRRAAGVGQYLMDKYGVARDRVVINYYGKENPVASNDTDEGRALNRRVEIAVGGLK